MKKVQRVSFVTTIAFALLLVGAVHTVSQEPRSMPGSYFEGPWEVEPNNSYLEANGPLHSDKDYYGYPNDSKDYFSIYLSEGGEITIDLTNHTGKGVQLQLFYQSVENRVEWDLKAPYHIDYTGQAGWYFIYIFTESGFNTATAYTLRTTFPAPVERDTDLYLPVIVRSYRSIYVDPYEPDNTSDAAKWIYDGSPQRHSIVPADDVDWVKFSLSAESQVVLETSGPSGDTRMWLYDSGLNELEYSDDDGSGYFSRIDRVCGTDSLPAGTYYVKIDEYNNDAEIPGYDLTFTIDRTCVSCNEDSYENDDGWDAAKWINDGSPQTHSICPVGDEDWVKFSLAAESEVVIEASGATGDTEMWLYDGGLNELEYDDDGGSGLFSRIDRRCETDALPAGTYYVKISEYNNNDEIPSFSLTFTIVRACAGVDVGPLVYSGHLIDDDNNNNSSGDADGIIDCGEIIELYVDLYNQGSSTAISVTSAISTTSPYATWLFNTDSGYPDIQGGGTGTNSNDFDFGVDAGTPDGTVLTFMLDVDAANGGPWFDSFSVPVTCDTCSPDTYENDDSSGAATWIYDGSPQTHSICPVGDEDWVKFSLGAESEVVLETSGPSGDTRMWLYDSGLNELEYDDDDGVGTFSLIDRECGTDPLPAGTYYVKIDEYASNEEIPSYDIAFSVVQTCAGGFNSQFRGSAQGWEPISGSWTVDSEYYSTPGLAGLVSSTSYAALYTDFDYEASLWRGGCDSCANRLIIRGTPYPLDSSNDWYEEYMLQYTRRGSYSVWRLIGGDAVALQPWASSSAINQGDAWNTLRVVADGSSLYFYINGTLVWSGSDSALTSGRVGIGMYRTTDSTGDLLRVDWATLSTLGATGLDGSVVSDTVSAEQQALNDAASRRPGGSVNVAPRGR